ncbi:hypothetical protein CFP56_011456 [Quercus suber]|uniref:Uncharacterized protein n=1 Tax=Quercus suber TaxID=58331 RepID=A0AAW0M4I2_QUESU
MSEDSTLFNNENFIASLLVVDGHMVARKKSWSLYYYLQELFITWKTKKKLKATANWELGDTMALKSKTTDDQLTVHQRY